MELQLNCGRFHFVVCGLRPPPTSIYHEIPAQLDIPRQQMPKQMLMEGTVRGVLSLHRRFVFVFRPGLFLR